MKTWLTLICSILALAIAVNNRMEAKRQNGDMFSQLKKLQQQASQMGFDIRSLAKTQIDHEASHKPSVSVTPAKNTGTWPNLPSEEVERMRRSMSPTEAESLRDIAWELRIQNMRP